GRRLAARLQGRLLQTASRPRGGPGWARRQGLDPVALRLGTGFEHLYYLLEAALAGLGVAIAPQPLVAAEVAAGRLLAPWGFVDTGAQWCLCTRAGDDPELERLADWLRAQLAATN